MTIENEIKEILKELPNENSRLDYKQIEYTKEKKDEFIKDILAMLNSIDSYNENNL